MTDHKLYNTFVYYLEDKKRHFKLTHTWLVLAKSSEFKFATFQYDYRNDPDLRHRITKSHRSEKLNQILDEVNRPE